MNKKLLTIAIALVILAMVVAPVAAQLPAKSPLPSGKPFENIWTFLQDLQNQIKNIPAGAQGPTGPTGLTGAKGDTGPAGKDGAPGPAGAGVRFGAWDSTSYSSDKRYTAPTDGFVVVNGYLTESATLHSYLFAYPAGNSGPSLDVSVNPGQTVNFCMPVRAGDTWSVELSSGTPIQTRIYWIPLTP